MYIRVGSLLHLSIAERIAIVTLVDSLEYSVSSCSMHPVTDLSSSDSVQLKMMQ